MRSGTENVPGIAGMGKAVELGMKHGKEEAAYVKKLRNDTIKKLFREIPYLRLNGDLHHRLPGNMICCQHCVLIMLDHDQCITQIT